MVQFLEMAQTFVWSYRMGIGVVTKSYLDGLLNKIAIPDDEQLREQYPALKQAWDHYQTLLKIAKAEMEL